MRNTDTTRFDLAKKIDIVNYLRESGVEVKEKNNGKATCKAVWRGDNNASVSIDLRKNIWYDFGTSQSGSIIDLVVAMKRVNSIEAVNELLSGSYQPFSFNASISHYKEEQSTQIISVGEIKHPALYQYMMGERRIPDTVFKKYCSEIHYQNSKGTFYAVGFKNNKGGYAIRNKRYKGNVGKQGYSLIKEHENAEAVMVFEGFIDFLTHRTIFPNDTGFQYKYDYLILNSTCNLKSAEEVLQKYCCLSVWFDNDAAGISAYRDIDLLVPKARVTNESSLHYPDANDLNESYVKRVNDGADDRVHRK